MGVDLPDKIVSEIAIYTYQMVFRGGDRTDLTQLSKSCGELAVSQLQFVPLEQIPKGLNLDQLSAFGERFGKHLGIFFLAEKEN